jgi:hypothetical protein
MHELSYDGISAKFFTYSPHFGSHACFCGVAHVAAALPWRGRNAQRTAGAGEWVASHLLQQVADPSCLHGREVRSGTQTQTTGPRGSSHRKISAFACAWCQTKFSGGNTHLFHNSAVSDQTAKKKLTFFRPSLA